MVWFASYEEKEARRIAEDRAYLNKCLDDVVKSREKRKRKEEYNAMLADWRRHNGCCPHCGKPL